VGSWGQTLEEIVLANNSLGEGVFRELEHNGFGEIRKLDVSYNNITGGSFFFYLHVGNPRVCALPPRTQN
jgi:hypothetical protein